jgi:catechol 2,3-dioxygenase-like lactoylglutathione lyase family enzyme
VLKGVHHAGVTVANLDRSLAFYRDLLGLEVYVVADRTDATIGEIVGYPGARIRLAFCGVAGDSARIELLEYLEPRGENAGGETFRPGSGHVCFRVDEIDELYQRIAAAGFSPRSAAPVTIAEGPNIGTRVFYVRDPDGYTVELFQPPPASV